MAVSGRDDSLEKELQAMLEDPSQRSRSRSRPRDQSPELPAGPADDAEEDLMSSDDASFLGVCLDVQTVNRLLDQAQVKLMHVGAAFNHTNEFSSDEKQAFRQRIKGIQHILAVLDRMVGTESA